MPTQPHLASSSLSDHLPILGENWENSRRQAHAERRLRRLRHLAVAGRLTACGEARTRGGKEMEPLFLRPPYLLTVSGEITWRFDVWSHGLPLCPPKDTLLGGLLEWIKPVQPDIVRQYELALEKVRGIVFDGVVHELLAGISLRRGLDDARCRALLLRNRQDHQLTERRFARCMNLGMTSEGDHWSKEIRKAANRMPNLKAQQVFTLGLSWLSPDSPLWLMSAEAMLKACRAMAGDHGWTEAVLDERLRDTKLRGARECLIRDVDLDEAGRIRGYVLAANRGLKEQKFLLEETCLKEFFSSWRVHTRLDRK